MAVLRYKESNDNSVQALQEWGSIDYAVQNEPGEAAGDWVGMEECADGVAESDGDQFLI